MNYIYNEFTEPYIKIPIKLSLTKEYLSFFGTFDHKLYRILSGYIIRKENKRDTFGIYENFYKKGLLASRFSQIDLASILDTAQSCISRSVASLEQRKYIRVYRTMHYGRKCCIYVLGEHNFKNEEDYYLEREIRKNMNNENEETILERLKKFEGSYSDDINADFWVCV